VHVLEVERLVEDEHEHEHEEEHEHGDHRSSIVPK
jgi:hypothetical protein